jgi:deoxyxylulose-5-phosphate synthase
MKTKAITSAIGEAKDAIKRIDAKIQALTSQREKYDIFVASGEQLATELKRSDVSMKAVTKSAASAAVHQSSQLVVPINGHQPDSVETITKALQKMQRPLTVPEIVEALTKAGTPIGGKYPRQNVRSTLHRRDDIFEKVGPALFGLREWPLEVKHPRQAKVQ